MSSHPVSANRTAHAAGAAFDRLAASYDRAFSHSMVGRAQRNVVWKHLLETFRPGDNVLEVNCGTGEDALFLASHGICVFACDASQKMIEQAEQRLLHMPSATSVTFCQLPTESIAELAPTQHFDGVFSNFSGLNCVSDLALVAASFSELVKAGGPLLLCFSTRICLTEIVYYLSIGRFHKAFRRIKGRSETRIDGSSFTVFYPTVKEIQRHFAPAFNLVSYTGIGVAIPPSYLEPFARKNPTFFGLLIRLENLLSDLPLLRTTGDHVLLRFERASQS